MTHKEITDRLLAEVQMRMTEQASRLVANKATHARWTVQVLSPLVLRLIQEAVRDALRDARRDL